VKIFIMFTTNIYYVGGQIKEGGLRELCSMQLAAKKRIARFQSGMLKGGDHLEELGEMR
jgi:hypothetical protein